MKTDRLTFLRLAGVTSVAAFAGGKYLGEPATASAMNSRFNTTLRLNRGRVVAAGPLGLASDEAQARVFAHVAQGDQVQSGESAWFSAPRWEVVLSDGPALKPGAADAYGVAYVENHDGSYEWYSWQVAVTLR